MVDETFLESLGLILIGAAAFALLARWLGLPAIVAYIVAGLTLGPLTGLLPESPALDVISEAGIVLLLFLVGLELTVEKIRTVGRDAALWGTAQIALTAPLGFGIALALGFPPLPAGVLAVGLTLSSTVVVVKGLVERRASASLAGQTAVGVLLVQDLFVIVLLTILAGLGGGGPSSLDLAAVIHGAGGALAKMGGVLLVLFVVARKLLPRPLEWARRSRETIFVASIAWCFTVVFGAHLLHLSAEIGAFLAGVSLAQFPHAHDLGRRVAPLMNGFVAVFFVTLGAGVTFPSDPRFWVQAIVLSVFVILGKFLLIALIGRFSKHPSRPAFETALMLTQISEFSFIFAAAAVAAGLADEKVTALLAVVGLLTITLSSSLGLLGDRLYLLYLRTPLARPSADAEEAGAGPLRRSGHVIIVGMNTLGRELARRLHARGTSVLAIDTSPAHLAGLPCDRLEGDASSPPVLEDAGLEKAALLVSTLHINDTNELLAYRARAAGVPCAIHAPDVDRIEKLLALGVGYVMIPKIDSLKIQRQTLRELGFLQPKR